MIVQGYIQFFRNTPPYVQLLFFYFALGQFTPTYSPDGWLEVPITAMWMGDHLITFFAGAFNVDISRWYRSGARKHTRSRLVFGIFARSDISLHRVSTCDAGLIAGAEQ